MQALYPTPDFNNPAHLFRNQDETYALAPVFGGVIGVSNVETVANNGFVDLEPGLL